MVRSTGTGDLVGATNLIPGPNSTEMAIHIGRVRAVNRVQRPTSNPYPNQVFEPIRR